MTDEELRAVVREAVARYAAPAAQPPVLTVRLHPSHALLRLASGSDMEGPCLIEPAVPCTHCGHCRSFGH